MSMEVYLVQHADSKSKEEDPERPITDKGRADAQKVAARIATYVKVNAVLHSPKKRARQTAEIFASSLDSALKEVEGLKPLDDPRIAAHLIGGMEESVMLVGHLPHLSALASLLIAGDETTDAIAFRNSAVVCIAKEEKWRIKWILTPEIA
jgi:phosphohistidine phosphatase